jgi:hypothetical protein
MATTDFIELDPSPEEEYTREGMSAVVRYQGPWADRRAFVLAMWSQDGGLGKLYPREPSSGARVSSMRVIPAPGQALSTDGIHLRYEHAIVTATFKTPGRCDANANEQQPETVDLVSETLEPNAEFMTLDHQSFEWASEDAYGSKALLPSEAPGKIVRGLDYCLVFHQVHTLPDAIFDLPGCSNNAVVESKTLRKKFAAETLIFHSPTVCRKWTSAGAGAWEVPIRFSYRKEGWNKFWRSAIQKWDTMNVRNGAQYRNYPTADFTPLLTLR